MARIEQRNSVPTLDEVIVTAGEMAEAINTVALKLLASNIITSEGFNVLSEEVRRLKRSPDATSWNMKIDRDNALVFSEAMDKNENIVIPKITCAGMLVEQIQHSRPPFTALDIALEIEDPYRKPVARWHVDWANTKVGSMQPGPLVHLQYGGHRPGYRDSDHPLKVPRWSHPPMEVLLLCEVVAANFFEEEWDLLREDRNWCSAIATAQKLCYTAYLRKMVSGLSVSSKTLLHTMWASTWTV